MAAYEFLYQEELYQPTDSVAIVINEPWETLREEDKTLLGKILSSVKVSLESVRIIHASHTDLKSLQVYNASKVVAFGASIQESTALYTCHKSGTVSFIASESLAALDDAKKKSLWGALKQLFI
jgi:hypothetical protein